MKKRFISSFVEAKFLIARCLTLLILALLSTNLAWGADTWEKLTSVPKTGDVVILVNETAKREMTGISTTSTKYGIATTYTTSPAGTYPLTVCAGSSDGTLAFKTSDDKYLTWTSGNSLNVNGTLDAKTSWTVSVSDGNFTITNANTLSATKQRYLKYNNGSGQERFACYESGQQAVQMYKKQGSTPSEPVAPSITTQPKGASYEKDATATALTIEASGNPTPTYQWYSNATESTSGASLISGATNASYTPSTATIGTKYYYCVATNTEGSATSDIVAVTVTAALPKITITADKIADFESSYKEYTWTANDVSGKCWAYRGGSSGSYNIQFNEKPYVYNTVAVPGKIKSIKIVKGGGSDRSWSVYCGTTALTSTEGGTQIGTSQTVSTSYTWTVPDNTAYTYFYLTKGSGSTQISEIVITYEPDLTPIITADIEKIEFEQKELDGTVTDSKTISATGKNLTAAISASMKEGSAAVFSVTPVGTPTAAAGEFTVSYSTTEAGEYSGTVVLSSGETSIEIPVSASVVAHIPVLQSIYVSGTPTKKEYTVGDAFETAGLEVWGKYDVGDDQQITEGIEWEVTPATFSATTETSVSVVAKALEKTSEAFAVENIKVNAAPQIATYDFTTNLYGHTGVSSSSSTAGDIAVDEIFSESPTQIKFIKSGNTATRFWDANEKHELRLYTNSEFNISAEGYNITKVEFDGSAANFTVDDVAIKNKIWSGKNKTVTFKTTATSNINKIMVYYAVADPSAATPTITPSAEAETYWEPITITLASTTEGAAIYYTTNGDAPTTASTLYENPFEVSATTTIKAFAVKDGLDNSEVATKEFKFGPIYANLTALVEAGEPTTTGNTVKVTLTNEQITKFYIYSGKTSGIYLNVPTTNGNKEIVIYCKDVPETWVVGGTVSGTLKCTWKKYSNMWELCPNSWNDLTYVAPTTVTIASSGYSSFSSTYAVTIPEGVTAYYATGVEGNKVSMIEVEGGVIPANEGVIIKGVASQEYTFIETVSDKTFNDNKLVAVSERIEGLAPEVTVDDVTYKNYVFSGGQFHPFTSGATVSVGAGKAYLQVEKPSDPNAKLEMSFGDVTGIESLIPTLSKGKGVYNLQGVRVNNGYKGIVIMNGKKYINK